MKPLTITMHLNYAQWKKGEHYEAVTFTDDSNANQGRGLGHQFRSNVKLGEEIVWESTIDAVDTEDKPCVYLINVFRKPWDGGYRLLTEPWYNSADNGKTIVGKIRQYGIKDGEMESYCISFLVMDNNTATPFTIDPIIIGHPK